MSWFNRNYYYPNSVIISPTTINFPRKKVKALRFATITHTKLFQDRFLKLSMILEPSTVSLFGQTNWINKLINIFNRIDKFMY